MTEPRRGGGSCNSSSGNSLFLFFGIRVETASAQIGNALVLQNYNDMTLDYFSLHTGWLGVVGAFCHGLPCTSDLHQHRSDSPELLSLLFFCFQRMRQATHSAAAQIFLLLHPSGRDLLEESRHISQLLLEFRLQRYEHTIHVIYHRFS